MKDELAIEMRGVAKAYGAVRALDGLDLQVPVGSVCAVLGPNGAGKTTAVRILSTLARPDVGYAGVMGHDLSLNAARVRSSVGLAGQNAAVDNDMTGLENLVILGRMLHLGRGGARKRAEDLLTRFDLAEAADRLVKTWSGGMRRRLDLIASFVVPRPVLLLDEPTTGLDPRSRNEIWSTVGDLVAGGTTVLLTTQYLEEADQLADSVVIIDRGRNIAADSPEELKRTIGARIDIEVEDSAELSTAATALAAIAGSEGIIDRDRRRISAATLDASLTLPAVVRLLDTAGIAIKDAAIRRPTLDEVFLHLTSNQAKETAA